MKLSAMELQPKSLTSTANEHILALCARAKELEETGKFEDARRHLSDYWLRIGDRPNLDGLDRASGAELLMRVGALSGYLGSTRQIPGAQEIAKDLISESAGIFAQLGFVEKVAEAHVDLGICYWREGALDEARITFDAALDQLGDIQSQQRLRALLNKAIVEEVSLRSKEALRILSEAEPLFELSTNHALRGKFHLEYAIELKNVGLSERREDYLDRSLMQYTAASVDFERVGNERDLALVENSIGLLFIHLGKFEEAHEHLDRALVMARKLNDKGYLAQFEDTRARAFLGQGRLEQAEKFASSAVKGFREGDEQSNLAVALTTQATILARKGSPHEALAMLKEAASVAQQGGDPETGSLASLTIIEELGSMLPVDQLTEYYLSAEAALKQSEHEAIKFRLGECARALLASQTNSATSGAESQGAPDEAFTGSLEERVLRYEGDLIKRALEASEGSITRAARLLGVTHQGLAFILNGRQKSLLPSRKPAKPRRRSIIRYH